VLVPIPNCPSTRCIPVGFGEKSSTGLLHLTLTAVASEVADQRSSAAKVRSGGPDQPSQSRRDRGKNNR